MKRALLLSTILVLPLTQTAQAQWPGHGAPAYRGGGGGHGGGGGFGSGLLGGVLGGVLGGAIGGAVTQPPQVYVPPTVYVTPPPVYYRVVPHHTVVQPVSAAPDILPDPDSRAYQQGSADRDQWEAWFDKQDGSMRLGAAFWADERSKTSPTHCQTYRSYGNDWLDGCTSAERRLTPSDNRRFSDAQYRNGWNRLLPPAPLTIADIRPMPPVIADNRPVAPLVAPAPVAAPIPAAAPASPQNGTLAKLVSADMLDIQVPYLETVTEPAKRVIGLTNGNEVRTYTVDHCPIEAHVKGSTVYAYAIPTSDACNVDLHELLGDDAPLNTASLTLGKFQKYEGDSGGTTFHFECLTQCGNQAEPQASLHWIGPHAIQYLEVSLVFLPLATQASADQTERLRTIMAKASGDAYVTSAAFRCDAGRYDADATSLLRNVKVDEIVIGHNIEDETGATATFCAKQTTASKQ